MIMHLLAQKDIENDVRAAQRDKHAGRFTFVVAGKNDRQMVGRYFIEREHQILSWKSPANKSIDVMIFDSTARKAYFSRGLNTGLECHEYSYNKTKN